MCSGTAVASSAASPPGRARIAACARCANADGASGPPPPDLRAERNAKFVIDGALTKEEPTATYNNFYGYAEWVGHLY